MNMDYSILLFIDCKTTLWNKPADCPAGQDTEIIHIDIVSVDTQKNQIIEQSSHHIKPTKSKIGQYCEDVFGISQLTINEKGIPFTEAYKELRTYYMSADRLWASWGTYEKYALNKQCKISQLEHPFTQSHLDIEHLFRIMVGQTEYLSLNQALQYCGILRTENSAVDVAKIYMKMANGVRQPFKTRIITSNTNPYNIS